MIGRKFPRILRVDEELRSWKRVPVLRKPHDTKETLIL